MPLRIISTLIVEWRGLRQVGGPDGVTNSLTLLPHFGQRHVPFPFGRIKRPEV